MTDPTEQETTEPWQRFTLLDAFLLQAGVAVGFSAAFTLPLAEAGWAYRAFSAVAFGFVAAGPIVLVAQWTLRGRAKLPTIGEQLWLASCLCWAAGTLLTVLVTSLDVDPDFFNPIEAGTALVAPMCALLLVQTVFSGLAVLQLFRRRTRNEGNPIPCQWTDRFGSLACAIFGLWLWGPPLIVIVRSF